MRPSTCTLPAGEWTVSRSYFGGHLLPRYTCRAWLKSTMSGLPLVERDILKKVHALVQNVVWSEGQQEGGNL